jgi:chorismate-pyruvate lyase
VDGCDLPEPYRSLLVHENDMTPTLEAFHGDRIALEVLSQNLESAGLWRLVVLRLQGSNRPVEFGAIVIQLEAFPTIARDRILEGRLPLGSIMAAYDVERVSRPESFFHIRADGAIAEALGTREGFWLYGRRNRLSTPDGRTLADIVEILPP